MKKADLKKKRRTIHLNVGGSEDDALSTLTNLEKDLTSSIAEIARIVDEKYRDSIPDICSNSDLLAEVRSCCEQLQNSVEELETNLNRIEKSLVEHHVLHSRLSSLKALKDKVQNLEEIEVLIRQIWLADVNEVPLVSARNVSSLNDKLKLMKEDGSEFDEIFKRRIYSSLLIEVMTLNTTISYPLNEFWKELVNFSDENNGETFRMEIRLQDSEKTEDKLNALNVLNIFDEKLSRFCSTIVKHFCLPIITSKNPHETFEFVAGNSLISNSNEYIIHRIEKSIDSPINSRHSAMFSVLLEFFGHLRDDFGSVKINNEALTEIVGSKISKELIETINREHLVAAIPAEEKDVPPFEDLLAAAHYFHKEMTAMNFFSESTMTFEKFAENYELSFIDRRCSKIIAEANSIISESYIDLVTAGVCVEDEEETIEEFTKMSYCITDSLLHQSGNFPKLLQFPVCKISSSTKKLLELVRATISASAEAESLVASARLLQTAENVVNLFIFTAPIKHRTEITTVPQMAAVFYNNCYYLCHGLMTATISLEPRVLSVLKDENLLVSFVSIIEELRRIAASSLETVLVQCNRQISTLLAVDGLFVSLDDIDHFNKCKKSLKACLSYISQISNVWKEVLTETILAQSLGRLASYFLSSLVHKVIAIEDMRACDADSCVILLKNVVENLEKMFIIGKGKHTTIHRFAESSYFQMKEVIFVLQATLQNIFDRWCDGQGPLAQWLKANQVRQLIKALFQNTDKRAYVLSNIY